MDREEIVEVTWGCGSYANLGVEKNWGYRVLRSCVLKRDGPRPLEPVSRVQESGPLLSAL